MKRTFTLVFALLLLTSARLAIRAQDQQQAPPPAEISDAQKRRESFDIVWKTVNERFYDPTFGGVDWTIACITIR